ncbi:MAG: hypothetical protein DI601_26065 [Azospirillum brasilense]|uniref:Uncharacterized protein n=1 Tax=Roseomonas gilardii TaxID=257708 RepID=A0A1L7ANM5_9PROT|nr:MULTISPECIES: hypothetical protein [Roseomonas]APT60284.1 hypothetical protein RGI145_23420 [Roseomonas gilardii]PZP38798.1 MAG: hypothetical protein DI601_26065 [Azospirillum brasilense]QDD97004.1 hypothetical protein ADP8_03883 [Roseomonas mucosa]
MTDAPPADLPDEPLPLAPARPEEITEALAYALRYDERGRPRPNGGELIAGLAAQHLTQHLQRAGFVLMKRRPGRPHRAG